MKLIKYVLFCAILLILLVIGFANRGWVNFTVPFYASYRTPLPWLMLVTFIVGVVIGLLVMLPRILVLRKEAILYRKNVSKKKTDDRNDISTFGDLTSLDKNSALTEQDR